MCGCFRHLSDSNSLPLIATCAQGCQDGSCKNCSMVFGSAEDMSANVYRYHLRQRVPDIDKVVSIRVAIHYPPELPSIRAGSKYFADKSRGAGVREKDVFIAHVAKVLGIGADDLLKKDVEVPKGVSCPILFIVDERAHCSSPCPG